MAREDALDTILMGAVGAGAMAVIGTRALEYYREQRVLSSPHIICTRCGEAMALDDVADPQVTCACATNDVRME